MSTSTKIRAIHLQRRPPLRTRTPYTPRVQPHAPGLAAQRRVRELRRAAHVDVLPERSCRSTAQVECSGLLLLGPFTEKREQRRDALCDSGKEGMHTSFALVPISPAMAQTSTTLKRASIVARLNARATQCERTRCVPMSTRHCYCPRQATETSTVLWLAPVCARPPNTGDAPRLTSEAASSAHGAKREASVLGGRPIQACRRATASSARGTTVSSRPCPLAAIRNVDTLCEDPHMQVDLYMHAATHKMVINTCTSISVNNLRQQAQV